MLEVHNNEREEHDADRPVVMETWTERAEEADRQAAALRRTVKYFRANPYEGSTPHVDALERRANHLDVDAAHYRRLAGLPPSVPGASGGELVSRDSSTVARVIRTSLESGHLVRLRVPQVRSVLDVVGVPEYQPCLT